MMSPAGVTKASDTEQKAARPQITTLQMGLLHRPSPPLQKLRIALPSAGSAGLPLFLMTLELPIPLRPSEQWWPLSNHLLPVAFTLKALQDFRLCWFQDFAFRFESEMLRN